MKKLLKIIIIGNTCQNPMTIHFKNLMLIIGQI